MPKEPNQQLGALLKRLRLKQNKSQEEVARASDIAHNYYGEIERGRREPGRETLLGIAQRGLGLGLSETNLVLTAAGFAPLPQVLTSTEIARLYKIVEAFLNKMWPYPALLASQSWGILKWNSTLPLVFDTPLDRIPGRQRNFLRLIFDPALPWRDSFVGWETFARYVIALFKRSMLGAPQEAEYQNLLAELAKLPDFSRLWDETHPDMADHYLAHEWPLRLNLPLPVETRLIRCRLVLNYFDQYSQLFALTFFPADPATEEVFASLGQSIILRP